MADQSVFVISGMAGVFPEAESLQVFRSNLEKGIESVKPVSSETLWHRNASQKHQYPPMALMDRIDQFDHNFFRISKREAIQMDPHQRILLELTQQALDDSCLAISKLKDLKTAVIATSPRPEYAHLLTQLDSLAVLGVLPAGTAGRLAYAFGATGPVLNVDTGCNSSLYAMWQAQKLIEDGECDIAIVASLSLKIIPEPMHLMLQFNEIMSPDGRCYAYDERAEGTASGEGGAVIIVARRSCAEKFGLNKRAIVRAVAVNHNGSRASSFSAPSVSAQKQLLQTTWRAAAIDPTQIGYFEGHGSGTRLGDAIEVRALNDAAAYCSDNPAIWLGSVKPNIGHLDHAAGMAGLVKTVFSLETATIFPSLNFSTPNRQIEFGGVKVAASCMEWPADGHPRIAALNSFSLVGANAHLILEETEKAEKADASDVGPFIAVVSSHEKKLLAPTCSDMAAAISGDEGHSAADFVYSLNMGRDHAPWRQFAIGHDKAELAAGFSAAARDVGGLGDPLRNPRIVILAAGDSAFQNQQVENALPPFAHVISPLISRLETAGIDRHSNIFHSSVLQSLLTSLCLAEPAILAHGKGKLSSKIASGELDLSSAGDLESIDTQPIDSAKLGRVLDDLEKKSPLLLVNLGRGGALSEAVKKIRSDLEIVDLENWRDTLSVLNKIGHLFVRGVQLDLAALSSGGSALSLPPRRFNKVRCWPLEPGEELIDNGHGIYGRAHDTADSNAILGHVIPSGPVDPEQIPAHVEEVWSITLKNERIDKADNFFALGGNSILAIEVAHACEARIGMRIPVTLIYDSPELESYIGSLLDLAKNPQPLFPRIEVRKIDRSGPLPLSSGQKRLWFLWKLDPQNPSYNLPFQFEIPARAELKTLQAALSEFVARHEALRSRFREENGIPSLIIDPAGDVEIEVVDIPSGPDADTQRKHIFIEKGKQPFDLANEPLYRFLLVREGAERCHLMLNVHHSVDDGWSPPIYVREISHLYEAYEQGRPSALPSLDYQYVDYADWQERWLASPGYEAGIAYWSQKLADPPTLELPADKAPPKIATGEGGLIPVQLDEQTVERLKQIASDNNTTLFVVILSLFYALLAKISGNSDIIIGTPTSGRQMREFHDVIGFFNNTVALRNNVTDADDLGQLIATTHKTVQEMLLHEDVPFDRVVSAVSSNDRDLARNPLVQALYVHQLIPKYTTDSSSFDVPDVLHSFESGDVKGLAPGTAKFDISLVIVEAEDGKRLPAAMEYRADLFSRQHAERFVRSFEHLIESACGAPTARLSALSCLTGDEKQALVRSCATPLPAAWSPSTILNRFLASAEASPKRVAVKDQSGGEISYADLRREVAAMASAFQKAGVQRQDCVGVLLPRNSSVVVAVLAIWSIGAIYVPLDIQHPKDRLEMITAEAGCSIVLTSGSDAEFGGVKTLNINDIDVAPVLPIDGAHVAKPEDIAYIIYTSGSTGKPKGVEIEHGSFDLFCASIVDRLTISADTDVAILSPLSFDVSLAEMGWALSCGAAAVILNEETRRDPVLLARALTNFDIKLAVATPTSWRMLEKSTWVGKPDLIVLSNGEVLPPDLARSMLPKVKSLWNAYGPTEATVWASIAEITREDCAQNLSDGLTIGVPLAGTSLVVLTDDDDLAFPGSIGHLVIVGPLVGRGYRGQDELTRLSFVDSLEVVDGERAYRTGDRAHYRGGKLFFNGRLDRQLKIRGNRVEPAEIEAAIFDVCDEILEVAVEIVSREGVETALCAFYVSKSGKSVPISSANARLGKRLPPYMLPTRWVLLESLPKTKSGKIDRKALSAIGGDFELDPGSSDAGADGNWLVQLVKAQLGKVSIDPSHSFFEVGGTSLEAAALAAKIKNERGIDYPLAQIIQASSLSILADDIERQQIIPDHSSWVAMKAGTNSVPLILVHPVGGSAFPYLEFVGQLPPEQAVFGLQAVGLLEDAVPDTSIEQMALRYADLVEDRLGSRTVRLAGWSAGGVIAAEMSRILHGRGVEIELLALFDSQPHGTEVNMAESEAQLFRRLILHNFQHQSDLLSMLEDVPQSSDLESVYAKVLSLGILPGQFPLDDVRRFLATLRANEVALWEYEPKPLDVPISLFVADETRKECPEKPDLGWSEFTTVKESYDIPGSHIKMVYGLSGKILAHHFCGCLLSLDVEKLDN